MRTKLCPVVFDDNTTCWAPVSDRQWDQDGMCSECAQKIWLFFGDEIDAVMPGPLSEVKLNEAN